MKRLLPGCIVLLGLGLLILHQLARLEELDARLARLRKEVALVKINPLPEAKAAEAAKPAPPARTERLEELIRQAHRVMGGLPLLHPEDLFTDYPQLETAFLQAAEGKQRMKYAGFFALAGFSEQQIDRFLDISLAGEREWIAQTKEATAKGVPWTDASIQAPARERASQRKQAMDELLGPAGRALIEKYREEQPARNALSALTKAMARGRQPISFDQLNQLATMTTETGLFDNDRPLQALDVFSSSSSRAAKILSPEQHQFFELMIRARQGTLLRVLDRRK